MTTDDPLSSAFWVRIGMALLCGGVLGLERQLRGKPAGIRTCALVCIGTMAFVRLGLNLQGSHGDPTRVLGQIVTGIGFLGAGVILTREGLILGMTSASVIWLLAAIGSAIGTDQYTFALALTFVAAGLLIGVEFLERTMKKLQRGVHVHLEDGADEPQMGSGSYRISIQPPPPRKKD